MKRLLTIAAIALIPVFYLGWPAWSWYQIQGAVKAKDAAALERKVDFARVRTSLREPMTERMSELYDRIVPKTGTLAGRLKQDFLPRLVELSLVALVTPDNVILAASERGRFKEFVDRAISDELSRTGGIPGGGATAVIGKLGELTGKGSGGAKGAVVRTVPTVSTPEPPKGTASSPKGPVVRTIESTSPTGERVATPAVPSEPEYGLGNIKQFAILGPFRFAIGIAKEATASEPDVTAEMSFTGTDWKVTAVRPRF